MHAFEKIQQYMPYNLYNSLLNIINDNLKKYKYINIDDDICNEIVLKAFENSEKGNDEKLLSSFEVQLKIEFDKYLKEIMEDEKNAFCVISTFINENISANYSDNEIIKEFKKLSTFLKKINYFLTPDLCFKLISDNKIFRSMLEKLVNRNIEKINENSLDTLFDDEILISAIESYCMIKNIEIKENNFNFNDFSEEILDSNYDSFSLYMNDMKKVPLLTREEEIELAYKIRNGDRKARKKLAESNLRLVVSVAKNYMNRGVEFLDLIQEGNIGLLKAIDRYDVTKGYKFSTYAIWWINQTISRGIYDTSRNIRLPEHKMIELQKYKKVESKLESKLNRQPTLEEIATELEMSVSDAKELYDIRMDATSINIKIGDKEDTEIGDLIINDENKLEETIINSSLADLINTCLNDSNIPERNIKIVRLRFGLDDNIPRTLEELAKEFGLTRERVRQIIKRVLRKLKFSELKQFNDEDVTGNIYKSKSKKTKNIQVR